MMEMLLDVAIILLAIALVGISYLAYKKSHLRATLYLTIAFLLFAFKKAVELSAEGNVIGREVGVITDVLEVFVLLLFLLALWRR